MTRVAVVILNYNGRDLLQRFLPSVVQHTPSAKIIVADNGSSDGSSEVISAEFKSVELLKIDVNLGFCGGYNYALKKIEADFYLLLNSDVEVTPGWLEPLMSAIESDPQVAAVQPKILSFRSRKFFEYAGAGGGLLDTLAYPFCRGRLFHAIEEDHGQYNDQADIFWASGACILIRSKLFHEHGGFDEDFFAHMEEIDLCWRLQRAGYRILYNGKSTVYHVGGGTLSASNPRKTYLNFKNGLSLLYKNLPTSQLFIKFVVRILLDWVASAKFALSGSFRDGQAVIRAHWHFFGGFRSERRRRKNTAKLGFSRPPRQYSGLIVWDFFVMGKRRSSELKT